MLAALVLAAALTQEMSEEDLCARFASYEPQQELPADQDSVQLAESFANGKGVRRDFSAAIHFLCSAEEIAPFERSGMLEHVQKMQRGETKDPLDYCEHISGGHGAYICAQRQAEEAAPRLKARLDAVRKRAGKATNAFDALRARADAFIEADATSASDVNRGGTIHASILLSERTSMEEAFVNAVERYTNKRAPAASAAEAKSADADLNAEYKETLAPLQQEVDLEIDVEHLRGAQRAWIRYRDAWIEYYFERWREAAPEDALRREILTQLTRDRIVALAER